MHAFVNTTLMFVRHVRVFVLGIQLLLSVVVSDHLDCVLMSLANELITLMPMYNFIFACDQILLMLYDDNLSHRLVTLEERNKMVES